jgi:hypothetical protein
MLSAAPALATGREPTIVSESASSITEHGATLEAQVNTGGLETTYAFWLGQQRCAQPVVGGEKPQCYILVTGPLDEGHIVAGDAAQVVSTVVTGLEANEPYLYVVGAVNSAGHVLGAEKHFRTLAAGGVKTEGTPPPIPENKPTPFEDTLEPWAAEADAAAAARAVSSPEQKQREREAANRPPATVPIPTGQWCGEADVSCETGEAIKPKSKTAGGRALNHAEKLAKDLKRCRKDHSRTRRAECEKQARQSARGKTKKGSHA